MAKRVNYIVDAPLGQLNVRENPNLEAKILSQLPHGDKVKIDPKAETPDGWFAVESGGYVMSKYLK